MIDQFQLQRLAQAAEHFVAGDILQRGYACSFAASGLKYDLVADINGLRKIQVKMTQQPYLTRTAARGGKGYSYELYTFSPGRSRAGAEFKMSDYAGSIDLFAFVAMDLRCILYRFPNEVLTHKMYIPKPDFTALQTDQSWSDVIERWVPAPTRAPDLTTTFNR